MWQKPEGKAVGPIELEIKQRSSMPTRQVLKLSDRE